MASSITGGAIFMFKYLLILFALVPPAFGKVSVVEIPIRIDTNFAKRVFGRYESFIVFRDPQGKLIAIPETMLGEMRQTAIDEEFDKLSIDDLGYIATPQQAVSNTAMATIEIEHLGDMRFWMNETYSFFVTWDDDHVAPVYMANGVDITGEILVAGAETPPPPPHPVAVLNK
jgi:hypothetical protein